ncbi:MAG: hypothetical protein KAR25_07570 [Methanosarcinales archaeon]|nr:hypothetical protein [Methanosarcinales archaeon]
MNSRKPLKFIQRRKLRSLVDVLSTTPDTGHDHNQASTISKIKRAYA